MRYLYLISLSLLLTLRSLYPNEICVEPPEILQTIEKLMGNGKEVRLQKLLTSSETDQEKAQLKDLLDEFKSEPIKHKKTAELLVARLKSEPALSEGLLRVLWRGEFRFPVEFAKGVEFAIHNNLSGYAEALQGEFSIQAAEILGKPETIQVIKSKMDDANDGEKLEWAQILGRLNYPLKDMMEFILPALNSPNTARGAADVVARSRDFTGVDTRALLKRIEEILSDPEYSSSAYYAVNAWMVLKAKEFEGNLKSKEPLTDDEKAALNLLSKNLRDAYFELVRVLRNDPKQTDSLRKAAILSMWKIHVQERVTMDEFIAEALNEVKPELLELVTYPMSHSAWHFEIEYYHGMKKIADREAATDVEKRVKAQAQTWIERAKRSPNIKIPSVENNSFREKIEQALGGKLRSAKLGDFAGTWNVTSELCGLGFDEMVEIPMDDEAFVYEFTGSKLNVGIPSANARIESDLFDLGNDLILAVPRRFISPDHSGDAVGELQVQQSIIFKMKLSPDKGSLYLLGVENSRGPLKGESENCDNYKIMQLSRKK